MVPDQQAIRDLQSREETLRENVAKAICEDGDAKTAMRELETVSCLLAGLQIQMRGRLSRRTSSS